MKRPNFLMRVKGALDGWRAPAFGYGMGHATNGGMLPKSWDWNWWQEGKDPIFFDCCAAVEAGVSAYAQTVAMLPGTVWRKDENNGRTELPNSPLARVLANPNDYQTRSDFVMNQIRALYFRGNCYAIAQKDNSGDVVALHPVHPDHCAPYVNRETNDVFWSLAPTDLTPGASEWPLDQQRLIPDEFVWHMHMATPYHPLCGVSPLTSACLSIATNCNMNRQVLAFLANMSRPSGTLNTDLKLTADAVEELRARWKEHSSGAGIGGTPILTHGLQWHALELSAPDTQLIDFYKLSIADIGRALRIPLPLIGVMDNATFNNAEVLMQFWKASGLGWLLEHMELSLDKFFGLPRDQYCELNADALLRSEFKNRIDALVRGVQGGVFAPNEARAMEGLAAVENGDMPRVQQQLVALDWEPPEPQAPAAPALPPPDSGESNADDFADVDGNTERAVQAWHIEVLRRDVAVLMDRTSRSPDVFTPPVRVQSDVPKVDKRARKLIAKRRKENADQQAVIDALLLRVAALEQRAPEKGDKGDKGDPGAVSVLDAFRGVWSIENIYQRGDIVVTPAGALYVAKELTHDWPLPESETWQQLTPEPIKGDGFTFRHLHVAGQEYAKGDVVTGPEGALWIWTRDEPGVSTQCPGEGWALMVKQGRTGGRGPQGVRGRDAANVVNIVRDADDTFTFYFADGRALRAEAVQP